MITATDSHTTFDLGKYFSIVRHSNMKKKEEYMRTFGATQVKAGFSYNSFDNEEFLSVRKLRNLIKNNIDAEFEPV